MRLRLLLATTGLVAVGGLILAGPAAAHITVSAPGATRGGSDSTITFRVPTESDTLSTTAIAVQFPMTTPIASVLVQAQPGWTFTEKTAKLETPIKTDDGDITEAVAEIDWKADGAASGIKPGEFGEFVVIAGQLPDAPSIVFKAVQTYSDGSVVRWIETPAAGNSAEPDHPAPTLQLAASGASPSQGVTVSATPSAAAKTTSNTGPVVVSIVALIVAAVAAVLGGLAFGRTRGQRS